MNLLILMDIKAKISSRMHPVSCPLLDSLFYFSSLFISDGSYSYLPEERNVKEISICGEITSISGHSLLRTVRISFVFSQQCE